MKNLFARILPPVAALMIAGCADRQTPVAISRLDNTLSSGQLPSTPAELDATRTLFLISGYGEPTDSAVALYAAMPSIASHAQAVDSAFADISAEEAALGTVFGQLERMLPGFTRPEVYAVISPFNQSIITADSMLFIGLNHYLGTGYEPYGYFPDFVRRRKVRSRIPADVAEAVIRARRPFAPQTAYPTLLDRMIYEGAVTQAVMKATDASEADVLGYDREESNWLRDHETAMWNTLLDRNLVYTTDPAVIRSAIATAPATAIISADAPGAAGRYIGSHIVAAWLSSHPDATIDSVLSAKDLNAGQFLRDSGY